MRMETNGLCLPLVNIKVAYCLTVIEAHGDKRPLSPSSKYNCIEHERSQDSED